MTSSSQGESGEAFRQALRTVGNLLDARRTGTEAEIHYWTVRYLKSLDGLTDRDKALIQQLLEDLQ